MNESITIATGIDVPRLNVLVNSAYRGDASRKGWTTEADLLDGTRITEDALHELIAKADTTILKFESSGQLLGCVELRQADDKLYLGMLSVSPTAQSQGIGKKLLAGAESFALSRQLAKIYMTVISVRQELIQWYERHGYRLTGETKPFIIPDERWGRPKQRLEFVVLEKKLSQQTSS